MKRALGLLLAAALLLSGCSADHSLAAAHLAPMMKSVSDSEQYAQDIQDIVQWVLDDLAKDDEDSEDSEDVSSEEAVAPLIEKNDELKKINGDIEDLALDVEKLKAEGEESYAATVTAAQQYFKDLASAGADMEAIFTYYLNVYEAIRPIEEFGKKNDKKAESDPIKYVDQLSSVMNDSKNSMKEIKCPAFMQGTHDELTERLSEFQLICDDLSYAAKLEDPLRIASCDNRIDRWDVAFDDSIESLKADFQLQAEQIQKRLDGRITTLRDELQSNIKAMQKAIG